MNGFGQKEKAMKQQPAQFLRGLILVSLNSYYNTLWGNFYIVPER